jgi:hypothetical protein
MIIMIDLTRNQADAYTRGFRTPLLPVWHRLQRIVTGGTLKA